MPTLETRAVWAMPMAERGKLQHGIHFRFVGAFELQRPCFLEKTVKHTVVTGRDSRSSLEIEMSNEKRQRVWV